MQPFDDRIRVRAARMSDLDTLVSLLDELFRIERDFAPCPEKQMRGLVMLLRHPQRARVIVIEVGGRVRGLCAVHRHISTAEGAEVGIVEDVVVAPAWRGRGLGARLLLSAEAWARRTGLVRLQLLADDANVPALKFYARGGWSRTSLIALRRMLPGCPSDATEVSVCPTDLLEVCHGS